MALVAALEVPSLSSPEVYRELLSLQLMVVLAPRAEAAAVQVAAWSFNSPITTSSMLNLLKATTGVEPTLSKVALPAKSMLLKVMPRAPKDKLE